MPTSEESTRAEAEFICKTPAGKLIAREAFRAGLDAAAELMKKKANDIRDDETLPRNSWWLGALRTYDYSEVAIRKLRKP